jgi:alkylation response protein AidB-like acyl-CoA dehydrogenase
MYFDLNDEQRAIKDTAREFLASRFKSERIREIAASEDGTDEAGWRQMSELGWPGLALPEEWGGQGLGSVELAVLFEEMGYALAPSPLFSSTAVGLALAAAGSDQQKESHLRPLAEGTRRGTPALFDAGSTATPGAYGMSGREDGDGLVLDGEKVLVPDAAGADFLLVATGDGRRHLVATADPGVTITPEPSIDQTRRLSSVRFEGVQVGSGATLPGHGADWEPVFDLACVALAAESTGVAQRALEMAVSYAKDRQQFGRPIGSYQAVSHRCAQMLLETENSRSAVYGAAWAADAEPESLPRAAASAKAYASDAGWRVPDASIQVHGGIGFTWEHDLHFFLKRGRANAALYGDARWHRERVAAAIFAGTAPPVAATAPAAS